VTEDHDIRGRMARTSSGLGRCAASLMLILGACASTWASEDLTILVMPFERQETPGKLPFTRASSPFDRIHIDNPDEAWQRLGIGHHHWLCQQLNGFALENLSGPLHVRFVAWDEALGSLVAFANTSDVLQVPTTWTAHLIHKRVLAPWPDLDRNDYPVELLNSCRVYGKGGLYAVPWHLDIRVLYCRRALVDTPDALSSFEKFAQRLDARYEEMKAAGAKKWQAPLGIGLARDWDILHSTFGYCCQGRLLERRWWRWYPAFHEERSRKGVRQLWGLSQQGLVLFVEPDDPNEPVVAPALAKALLEGQCDAVIGGPQMRRRFLDDHGILAAPLPGFGSDPPVAFLGGSHLAVSKQARKRGNETEARKLVEFLTTRRSQVELAEETGALPARRDALETYVAANPRWNAFSEALGWARTYPSIPEWAEHVERPLVLDHFYAVLQSMQRKEDWPVIRGQLEAAAGTVMPPFPWLAATVVGVGLASIGGGSLVWRERRRRKRTERQVLGRIDASIGYSIQLRNLMTDLLRNALVELEGIKGKQEVQVTLSEKARLETFKQLIGVYSRLGEADAELKSLLDGVSGIASRLDGLTHMLGALSDIQDTLDLLPGEDQVRQAADEAAEQLGANILAALPTATQFGWDDLDVRLVVNSVIPPIVTIRVTGPQIDHSKELQGSSAAWLAEMVRDRDIPIYFHVWATETVPTSDKAAQRAGPRRARIKLREIIIDAVGGSLPGLRDDDFFVKHQPDNTYRYQTYPSRIESRVEEARELLDQADSAVGGNPLELYIEAAKADPGSPLAWQTLRDAVNAQPDPVAAQDMVRNRIEDRTVLLLRGYFLRHLKAANLCYARDPNSDVCGRLASDVAGDFAKSAESLYHGLELLERHRSPQAQPAAWGVGLANCFCPWLDQAVTEVDLSDTLCLAVIANSKAWQSTPMSQDATDCLQAMQNTGWFSKALVRLRKDPDFKELGDDHLKDLIRSRIGMAMESGSFPPLDAEQGQSKLAAWICKFFTSAA